MHLYIPLNKQRADQLRVVAKAFAGKYTTRVATKEKTRFLITGFSGRIIFILHKSLSFFETEILNVKKKITSLTNVLASRLNTSD